ncbi:UNVERIFIED_CONTAM: hypothetical protein FKN15_078160 [Acipenser sinensis]
MGRKSCKKQQKRRQQQQLPPGDVGPRYVVDEWCPGCGEFGHTVAICPTQYQEEEVEPQPQEEDGWEALLRSMGVPYCCFICREVGHFPANCPLPPVRDLWYPPTPAEGEFLLVPPPPTAGAEQQELSLSPPQSPAEGEFLLVPPPPTAGAEQQELSLSPPQSPAEGEFLLVPPPPAEGACLLVSRLQLEGEEPLPPSQPEGEEDLPPSQPEGEEPLPPSAPSPPSPPSPPPSLPPQSPSQPEGEEALPPSQPEGEEALPPSQPEGEEPLPPSQPEGEEALPPRNQLSTLPACLCGLPLKVLIASNNKLGALPEEIGQLNQLMELDISCNEITALPQQIGQLKALRELNVRRNYLSVLPEGKICIKGREHIFKYLYMEACRIDKTADSLYLPVIGRLSLSQPAAGSIEDIDQSRKQDTDSGLGSDNGDKRLSATEPSDEDTVSLNAPMSNITEEESFSKEDSSEHMNPFKEESDQGSVKLIENNNPEEGPQDKFVYRGPGLSTPFVTYMKASFSISSVTNPPNNQEIHIEMINQLREAVELLQDPNSGQTYQDVSMTHTRESIGGELEFQKKRELILGKANVEAQLVCQRFERQMSNQCVCIINPLTSGTAHWSLLKPLYRNLDMVKTVLEIRGTTVRWPLIVCFWTDNYITEGPLTQALAGDNASFTTPTEGGMTNSVFLRTPRKLESMDPQFTIRRKMEQMREELDLMDQLRGGGHFCDPEGVGMWSGTGQS